MELLKVIYFETPNSQPLIPNPFFTMAAHDTVYEYYLYQHHNIERYVDLCLDHAEPEFVHQLRLSIKKLRAFNRLIEQMEVADSTEHLDIKHRVRQLFKLAGELRDTQVQIRMLTLLEEKTGIEYPEFAKWLLSREKKRISQFAKKPHHIVSQSSVINIHHKIGKILAEARDEKILESATLVLEGLYSKTQKLTSGAINIHNLHRIRIYIKQIRYVFNIIYHSYPDFNFGKISVESLREIEIAAGRWHDNLVRVELLEKYMERIDISDKLSIEKYKKLLAICNSELQEAYVHACSVVKKEIHEVS